MKSEANENHIALFVASLAGGGAERVMLNLAEYFVSKGYKVDLILAKYEGQLIDFVPDKVRVIELEKRSWFITGMYMLKLPVSNWISIAKIVLCDSPSVFRRLESFVDYLRNDRPAVVLSTLNGVNITSLIAKSIAKVNTKFYVRQAIFLSQHAHEAKDYFNSKLMPILLRKWYPIADGVISVSKVMSEDLIVNADLDRSCVTTIYNPLNLEYIDNSIKDVVDDPFFIDAGCPIIVSAGRLVEQKDYPTLLIAVKNVMQKRNVRLLVLGGGPELARLERLCSELLLDDYVKFLGRVSNPYKYISRSDVFVLCSMFEGMPNVLLEALACQCNIVSTDCPSGPSEILENGEYGTLVPVGSVEDLTEAILCMIDSPMEKMHLRNRANAFSLDAVGAKYLNLMFAQFQNN